MAVQLPKDMPVRSVTYAWEDRKRLGYMKFGDHTVPGYMTYNAIVENTTQYIRGSLARQKYVFDEGDIIIHWIIDVTEFAHSVGKNYKGAKIDSFIANELTDLKHYRVSKNGGDFYKIPINDLTRKVNQAVFGASKLATFGAHKYQMEAVKKAVIYFKNGGHDFLLDAVTRFGKIITAYLIAKELACKKILVLTGRPKVKDGWRDDLDHVSFADWRFIDSQEQSNVNFYMDDTNGVLTYEAPTAEVIFASFQGSKRNDSRIANLIDQEIDMVIIDEAHAYFSQEAIDFVRYKINAKHKLWISGTPFKAYESGMFDGVTDTYRFTLLDLLREKSCAEDAIKRGETIGADQLRYTEFPDVQFLVAEYPKFAKADVYDPQGLNMRLLLSSNGDNSNYPDEVKGLLDSLLSQGKRSPFNLGAREIKHAVNARHVWMAVPAGKDDTRAIPVAAAAVLEKAVKDHALMKDRFEPLAIRGDKDQDAVNRHITLAKQSNKGSICISCRSLNTGTKFPDIDTVVFLTETTSASEFWQTVGRALQPMSGKKSITVICYSIEMMVTMANKMVEYSVQSHQNHNEVMTELLSLMPIFTADGPRIKPLKIEEVYSQLSTRGSVTKSFGDREVLSKDFDHLVMEDLSFFLGIPDIASDKIPNVQQLYKSGNKGQNNLVKHTAPLTKAERDVVADVREKLREFLKQIGSVMAACLLYNQHLITSTEDLKEASESTIDNNLYPGTKDILVRLLEKGALNQAILDKKIGAFYNVELKDKIHA